MSGRSCATGSVRSCSGVGSVRLGAALAGPHEVVLDALYERKQDKKTVRVLTVIVYVFCVSLAAIMLSLYYVFFWEPKDSQHAQRQVSHTLQQQPATATATATATSPMPTCFMPHTGRSNFTIERNEPPDSESPSSYDTLNISVNSSAEIAVPAPVSVLDFSTTTTPPVINNTSHGDHENTMT